MDNHFTNVGFNLAKNISSPDKDVSIYDYLGEGCNGSMFLVDEQEIIRTVQFKKNVSTDFTDINMSMVKTIINEIVKPLNHICNVSFQTGVFPNQIKIAKVILVFKAGDKCVFTNYRPICLLQEFSKILEKLYNARLDNYPNRYDLLSQASMGLDLICSLLS